MYRKRPRIRRLALSLVIVLAAGLLTMCASQPVSQQAPLGIGCVPRTVSADADSSATMIDADAAPYAGLADSSVIEVRADAFSIPVVQDEIAAGYAKSSVLLQEGESLVFTVNIAAAGDYTAAFDLASTDVSSTPEGEMRVDDAFPTVEFERFRLPVYYRSTAEVFPKDRHGNDALIPQVRAIRWTTMPIRDVNFSQPYPARMRLTAGEHRFALTLTRGAAYIGSLYLKPFATYPDYADYAAAQVAPETNGFSVVVEAEMPTYKNDTSVRPNTNRNLTVTPYDTYCQLMNTLGGDSWIRSGSAVYYEIDVPEEGLYAITLRALQSTRSNFTVFRRISVNGVVPFEQFNAVPFSHSPDWVNRTLGSDTPYRVHLRAGVNVIGVEATNAPYLPAIETIQEALADINTLALEINRLTGNQRDPFREWVISDYIPDIEMRLNTIAQNLLDDKDTLLSDDPNNASPESLTYQMAIDNILFLASEPNDIPLYMRRFSQGSGSAAQLLGSLLTALQNQPLALDKIIVHSPDTIPAAPSVPFTTAISEDFRRFLFSFQPDPYRSLDADDDELEVWVNRPRQYVNLLQLMADTTFTAETGIRVRFSIMPDESKLILANAADIQPDVALGVSVERPYELAIRNALYDLRTFPDFDSYIRIFQPGALLGYIINDSVYALPETQDFWVTFYRRDILGSLGLPVPRTWDEVIEILPELQRAGMNYNTPLSTGTGQRGYLFTVPYLFNYGAELYADGGFSTGIQSEEAVEAIRFMADSFTIYGMPLTTSSFYESFRYGTLPIGIANASTYIQLSFAAPEISGLWDIDLYPATVLADGTQNRYATGSAQTSIMFANTDMPDEGWQFMQWWMSTETQVEFQDQLVLNYGREYLWFSANVDAMRQLDIPETHRNVILEQWEWMREPVRLPGSYMQERELSNIWNRIVFDGINARVAIDRSVITINREITRKMEEFGYLQDGVQVREFIIPTIEMVAGWMQHAD